jgi:hypothetical protein
MNVSPASSPLRGPSGSLGGLLEAPPEAPEPELLCAESCLDGSPVDQATEQNGAENLSTISGSTVPEL